MIDITFIWTPEESNEALRCLAAWTHAFLSRVLVTIDLLLYVHPVAIGVGPLQRRLPA